VINATIKLRETRNKMANEKSLQSIEGQGERKCPECGSADIIRKDNEVYCRKCGLLLD
jgi:predicted RNA-binding Zn-ribbon protein involved in translation (DUF1610 family)